MLKFLVHQVNRGSHVVSCQLIFSVVSPRMRQRLRLIKLEVGKRGQPTKANTAKATTDGCPRTLTAFNRGESMLSARIKRKLTERVLLLERFAHVCFLLEDYQVMLDEAARCGIMMWLAVRPLRCQILFELYLSILFFYARRRHFFSPKKFPWSLPCFMYC